MSKLPVNLIRDIAGVEYNRGHIEGFEAGIRMSMTLMHLYALLSSMLEIAAYESNRDALVDKLRHMAMDRAGQPTPFPKPNLPRLLLGNTETSSNLLYRFDIYIEKVNSFGKYSRIFSPTRRYLNRVENFDV
ncbi:MAG: hypothetical protein AAF787_19560 [Chloroflexota bacterium]